MQHEQSAGRRCRTTVSRILLCLLVAALAIPVVAGCDNGGGKPEGNETGKPTRDDVVAFVEEAVAYARENGKENALAEFSDPNGSFKRGELYIYAYDFEGNVLGHGGDASLIGKNLIDYEDPNGVKVIQGLIEVAKGGQGWFSYTWNNPQTGNQEPKLGYVMKVDDTWWLGSGTYGN